MEHNLLKNIVDEDLSDLLDRQTVDEAILTIRHLEREWLDKGFINVRFRYYDNHWDGGRDSLNLTADRYETDDEATRRVERALYHERAQRQQDIQLLKSLKEKLGEV